MKLRIRYMYEEGNSTILEKITESGSITEFLNKAEYISQVQKYMNYTIKQIAKDRNVNKNEIYMYFLEK